MNMCLGSFRDDTPYRNGARKAHATRLLALINKQTFASGVDEKFFGLSTACG